MQRIYSQNKGAVLLRLLNNNKVAALGLLKKWIIFSKVCQFSLGGNSF